MRKRCEKGGGRNGDNDLFDHSATFAWLFSASMGEGHTSLWSMVVWSLITGWEGEVGLGVEDAAHENYKVIQRTSILVY